MKIRLISLIVAAAFTQTTYALTPLTQLRYTPDISVNLAGVTFGTALVANGALNGNTPTLALSGLAGNVAAYRYAGSGIHWLVFATTVLLPGAVTATPRDVIAWNGSSYTVVLNGANAGIAAGATIDALSSSTGSDFLLSFDTTVNLGGVTAAPADVMRYAAGTWSRTFTASTSGVPAGVNLDALHYLSNGHLLVSFDIAGRVGGVSFTAGDVLEFTPSGAVWEKAFSPATVFAGWGAANLHGLWAAEAASTSAPSPPTNVSVVLGVGKAIFSFTEPSATGGVPIVDYTATCSATGHTSQVATGTKPPIVVNNLSGGVTYSCTLTANNGTYVSGASTALAVKAKADLTPILMLLLD